MEGSVVLFGYALAIGTFLTIDHIHQTFLDLLTQGERKALSAIVTSQPCVEKTFAPSAVHRRDLFFCGQVEESNPYLPSRAHGCLKPGFVE